MVFNLFCYSKDSYIPTNQPNITNVREQRDNNELNWYSGIKE